MKHNYIKSTVKTCLLTVLLSVTLLACNQAAEDPKSVADKYWQHMQSGNTIEAEKLISTNSRPAFTALKDQIATIQQLKNNEAITIVSTTITTTDPDNGYTHTQTFDTIMVLQDGQWKIDADRTHTPLSPSAKEKEMQELADKLSDSMQENVESIDKAMTQGMKMLNEAMRDGSKEMGESFLHMMNELNSSMQKSIDKMKQRREQRQREQQLQEQQQQEEQLKKQPDPDKGEGMI